MQFLIETSNTAPPMLSLAEAKIPSPRQLEKMQFRIRARFLPRTLNEIAVSRASLNRQCWNTYWLVDELPGWTRILSQ